MSLSSRKQAKLVEKIRGLAKESGNKKCFICQRMGPHSNVVVSPLQVFVCNQCAGLHRNFSHRIKGISVASFSEAEVAALEANGNKRERRKWLAKYKESDCPIDDESTPAQVQKFMQRVFEKKEWFSSKPTRRHEHLKKSPASNSSRHRASRRHRERRDTRGSERSDDEQSDSAVSTSSHRSRHANRRRRDDRRSRRGDTDTPRSQGGRQRRSSASSETTPRSAASPKSDTHTPKVAKEEKPATQESGLVDLLDNLILTPGFGRQQSKSAELDDTMLGQEEDAKATGASKDTDDDFDDAAFPDDDGAFGDGGANGTNSDAKKLSDAFSHLVPAIQDNSLHTNGPTSANFEQGITHLLSVLSQVQMQYQFSDVELKNACRSALERIQKQNAAMVQSRVMAAQTGAYVTPPGMYPYAAAGGPPGAQMMSPHPTNGVGPAAAGGDPFGDGGDNPFDDTPVNGAPNSQMPATGASPWNNVRAQYAPQAGGGYGGPAPGFANVVSQAMPQAAPAVEDEDANNPFA